MKSLSDKIMLFIVLVMLLPVPFLIHQQIQKTKECKTNNGILVNSTSGWRCIEFKKAELLI